jgi:hypothetical protein
MSKKQPLTQTVDAASSIAHRVVEILRGLNPNTADLELQGMAMSLLITAQLGAVADLPRARDIGSKKARRELITLANLSRKLIVHIHGMHSDGLRGFERVESRGELHPLMIADRLRELHDAAMRAQEGLSDTSTRFRNRPKRQAQEVTRMASKIYKRFTGEAFARATNANRYAHPSYGPSLKFLTDLFNALHISASPDGQLKTLKNARLAE